MRVNAVFRPADFKPSDDATQNDADAFFAGMFPGVENPEIPWDHAGMAVAALNPKLAQQMGAMSRFMALDLNWSRQRPDLRELAIQTIHLKLKCGFGFESRIEACEAAGISSERLAALTVWKNAPVFDDEQRLVIEYAESVADSAVTDELFRQVVAQFGEKGAIEMTAVIGFWSCWSMIINAADP